MRNLTPLFLLLLARLSLSGEGTEGLFYGQEKVHKAYFMVRRRYRRLILWSGEGTEGLFNGQEKVQKAYFMVRRRYSKEGLFSHFKTGVERDFYLTIFRQSADSSAKKVRCVQYYV